jgi:dTDP-4-dehydrorhamnose 3,5-epimerase
VNFIRTELPGVIIVEPKVFRDDRGFFAETYQKEKFAAGGIGAVFVQDNHCASTRGVLRGMHLQLRRTQGKLVRAIEGAIWDVALEVRKGSPAFGFWVGVELSASNFKQLYVPPGYAHGYCVLSEKAQVEYKVTDFYDPESEVVVRYDDPEAGIEWPIKDPILSKRDAAGKTIAELAGRLPAYPS